MNVVVFGATGMIGQGVLLECLRDPSVVSVITVGRRSTGKQDPKLTDIVVPDVTQLSEIEPLLTGLDACFFSLGVSSIGMSEERYSELTYDLTMSVAQTLLRTSPGITFVYVSGASTDSTEKGAMMWARVKGRLENALLAMPFKAAYMFRPGAILPLDNIKSSTGWYNAIYTVLRPFYPAIKAVRPNSITTTQQLARAMIAVARGGHSKRVLEMADINGFEFQGNGREFRIISSSEHS